MPRCKEQSCIFSSFRFLRSSQERLSILMIRRYRLKYDLWSFFFFRNPHVNLDTFLNRIHRENKKLCFVRRLGSYYSQPQTLKPHRKTDHSVPLIDKIFFNFLQHFSTIYQIISLTINYPLYQPTSKFSDETI